MSFKGKEEEIIFEVVVPKRVGLNYSNNFKDQ